MNPLMTRRPGRARDSETSRREARSGRPERPTADTPCRRMPGPVDCWYRVTANQVAERKGREMKAGLTLLVALAVCLLVTCGCANPMLSRMPPRTSIPREAPAEVRKNIRRLYRDAQWRAHACTRLHGPEAAVAIPFLIPLLGDNTYAWSPSFLVRYIGTPVGNEAMSALTSIGEPAIQPLITALGNDLAALRTRAALALGKIGDVRAIGPLEQAADGDPSADVREAAACALAGIVSPRTLGRMAAALNHKFRHVQWSGFRSLSLLNDPRGDQFLVSLLQSDDWQGRRCSVLDVLRKQGRVDVVPTAIAGLKDPDKNMRAGCAMRLAEWKDPRGLRALIGSVGDDYGDVRVHVIIGLEALGTPEAVRALCRLVADPWCRVSDDADAALVRLGSRAVPPLIDMLETDPEQSGTCRSVLKRVTGEDFGNDIGAWRRWVKQHAPPAATSQPSAPG